MPSVVSSENACCFRYVVRNFVERSESSAKPTPRIKGVYSVSVMLAIHAVHMHFDCVNDFMQSAYPCQKLPYESGFLIISYMGASTCHKLF